MVKKEQKDTKARRFISEREKDKKLVGLGGWLIFVEIGLWISLFYFLMEILNLRNQINIIIITIYTITYFAIAAGALFLFYSKSKIFKNVAIILLWYPFAFLIISILIYYSNLTPEGWGQVLGSLIGFAIGASIWTAYFTKSRRVKNTFVN